MKTLTERSASLSPRELEVARLVAEGLPDKTIAGILQIKYRTVQEYLDRISRKIGRHDERVSRRGRVARYINDIESVTAA